MVSALHFRSRGRWFEPSLCCHVVSLDKKLYSTLSLLSQMYKWVPAIILLGGNFAMGLASHPRGSSNIPGSFMRQKLELSTSLMGLLACTCMQTSPYRANVINHQRHKYHLLMIQNHLVSEFEDDFLVRLSKWHCHQQQFFSEPLSPRVHNHTRQTTVSAMGSNH